ncbi:hypothetical protein CTRI78_v006032 [Colletotrichum trifolii]|uniref:Uncharacterized protein n=1 Tax=Colletotrichum trifolii TaxID=5466 RepID=A0A4R8RDF5_COLTR|nr:hypothetical protein CTRI78_v006032 [Colletotrichum trifolii]
MAVAVHCLPDLFASWFNAIASCQPSPASPNSPNLIQPWFGTFGPSSIPIHHRRNHNDNDGHHHTPVTVCSLLMLPPAANTTTAPLCYGCMLYQ